MEDKLRRSGLRGGAYLSETMNMQLRTPKGPADIALTRTIQPESDRYLK